MDDYKKDLMELNEREKQTVNYVYEDELHELARKYDKERDDVFYDWMDLRIYMSMNKM